MQCHSEAQLSMLECCDPLIALDQSGKQRRWFDWIVCHDDAQKQLHLNSTWIIPRSRCHSQAYES